MKVPFISFHVFNFAFGRYLFDKDIKKAGGEILETKKQKGKYLVKVSNPHHKMNTDAKWYQSNINFFKQSFQTF